MLTPSEHAVILFGIAVAGLALVAMLVRTVLVRREISGRYRSAVAAAASLLTVAALSYGVILVQFVTQYRLANGRWLPAPGAQLAWSTRYVDWAVTVPLLVVELLAVSSLVGAAAVRARAVGVGAAFLMIAAGYLGGVAIGGGEDFTALSTWGLVSSVFFGVLYVLVLTTVVRSLPALPSAARPAYRGAMVLLMITWFVYPAVFGLQGLTVGGAAATVGQLLLCAADVAAKVGFGLLIHKVAKLRTAFDVQAGIEIHQETLWVDGLRQSDAHLPPDPRPATGRPRS